jgi:DtxR family transcriptional regulator, Mn-dependent transcriptional regulator
VDAAISILTPALEDYLKAIWQVSQKKDVVRVKDIKKLLKVSPSSIVESVKNLAQKKIVEHERYGYIKLTERGIEIAKKIQQRHKLLSKFFNEIIGLDLKTAANDACGIEHYLSDKTIDRLIKFIEFIENCPEGEPLWLSSFHYYVKHGKMPDHCLEKDSESRKGGNLFGLRLDNLKIGDSGKVKKLIAGPAIKRRLMDMGIVPGVKIKVEKVAPLGDPVDVFLKGYHLSLRKDEAASVYLEEQE